MEVCLNFINYNFLYKIDKVFKQLELLGDNLCYQLILFFF